jgi:hypothetical protein
MDLYRALKPYGIRMMLYTTGHPPCTLGDAAEKSEKVGFVWGPRELDRSATPEASAKWIESLAWWSKHYGEACSGWWVDGDTNYVPGHSMGVKEALMSGNPDALYSTCWHNLSDFNHGHCGRSWEGQQKVIPPAVNGLTKWWSDEELAQPLEPEAGRWTPIWKQQWHLLQHLGSSWTKSGVHKDTKDLVAYAKKCIGRGGVMTFDVGVVHKNTGKSRWAPILMIDDRQLEQLKAVRDAIKDMKR